MSEFCINCEKVTASVTRSHPSGTEFRCATCGDQVDFLHDDGPDDTAIGSCEECGTNLYADDHPEFCDQCLRWASAGMND